ncbi:hypothetical protein CNR22_12080 [Sphingobacteriaceae bacterium]|nr:hypothetical protein CNR22_12080 [Sphingobacteriaceae bacterium]
MTFDFLFYILRDISVASILVPIACCIIKRKALNVILRALFVFLILSCLFELTGVIFAANKIETYTTENIYTILECSFIIFMYYKIFETGKTKTLILIFYGFFMLISVYQFLIQKGYHSEDSVVNTCEAVFVLILGWSYLFKLMKELKVYDLREHYFFWLNFGFVLYFSMAFVLFLFYNYLGKLPALFFQYLWSLHLLMNITSNLLISRGVWKAQRR